MTSTKRALMILSYGQSNADMFLSGPRPDSPLLRDTRVLTIASGVGLRGEAYTRAGERKNRIGSFYADGCRLPAAQIKEIMPAAWCEVSSAFITHTAAAVTLADCDYRCVYVRAAAKGGIRLIGVPVSGHEITAVYRQPDGALSPITSDLIRFAGTFLNHARSRDVRMERPYILFIHGEADRATDPTIYLQGFRDAKAYIDQEFGKLGLLPNWLFTQAAGTRHTHSGNDWHSRQVANRMMRLPDENLWFLGPLYPYPLADAIHHDAVAKTLIGELAAAAIRTIESGKPWRPPMPDSWYFLDDRRIRIEVLTDSRLVLDDAAPGYEHYGFSLAHQIRNGIQRVELDGPHGIVVTLDAPIAGRFALDYAFRRRLRTDPAIDRQLAYGGGQIRTEWSTPSRVIDGATLHHWLPGFRLEIPEGRQSGSFDEL